MENGRNDNIVNGTMNKGHYHFQIIKYFLQNWVSKGFQFDVDRVSLNGLTYKFDNEFDKNVTIEFDSVNTSKISN